ncbi:MAG: M48 family metallopeptidase [Terracidiphilus sp.]|jgi:heat shock protein HtpX
MSASRKITALAVALWFATLPLGRAQSISTEKAGPDVVVRVRTFISGDAAVSAYPGSEGMELAPALQEVVHCPGSAMFYAAESNAILCPKSLRRDGLALEGVVDLAPVVRNLDPSTGIELWLDCPRLGFESASMAMTERGGGTARLMRSIRFQAGSTPPPIHIRFGYRLGQLAGFYLPLAALALALTVIAAIMSRAGLGGLNRSAVLLGTIVWMGAAAQIEADGPLRILLYETPFANLALLLMRFWPPLLCVSIGSACGKRMRTGQTQSGKSGGVLASLTVVPLLLTCVAGILLSLGQEDAMGATIWLAITPTILFVRRFWLRTSGRFRVRQLREGELKEHVSALAARAGCPQVKIYISSSTRSDVLNAFAWPRRFILFTAPLVRSLSRREVDAIAAHELSHSRHLRSRLGIWVALCLAMILCETPVTELLLLYPGGLLVAMLLPIMIFFAALHGMRKCEFAADAGSAALTEDPRAMISSLARITRINNSPLDMNLVAEWFSTHPSVPKRIRTLAAAAKLEAGEVERLCGSDDTGDPYELLQEKDDGAIFATRWRRILAKSRLTGKLICKRARNIMHDE